MSLRALQAAKRAKDAGQDVAEARRLMKECRDAIDRGAYDRAVTFAEEVVRMFGGSSRPPG